MDMTVADESLDAALRAIADALPRCGETKVVAIDGPSGAGKTYLTAALAARIPGAHVLHMDDLYTGWDGLEKAVDDLYERVLSPISRGGVATYRQWDWEHERYAGWRSLPPAPLLLVDGVGSSAGRSAELESVVIWVQAHRDVRFRRGIDRDGQTYLENWQRWAAQEEALFLADRTRDRADVIVDTTP